MASYPQRKLMTDILNLPGFIVKDYGFIDEVGIVLSLENILKIVRCPHCGSSTDKLHQNNFYIVSPLEPLILFYGVIEKPQTGKKKQKRLCQFFLVTFLLSMFCFMLVLKF